MTDAQERKLLRRVDQHIQRLEGAIYQEVADVPLQMAEVESPRYDCKTIDDLQFSPIASGAAWGTEWQSAIFVGEIETPRSDAPMFLQAETGGESYVTVNGQFVGALDRQHKELRVAANAKLSVVIESYAGHWFPGNRFPGNWAGYKQPNFRYARIVTRRDAIWALYYDVRALRHLIDAVPADGFQRDELIDSLDRGLAFVDWMAIQDDDAERAREALAPLLGRTNGDSAPTLHLVGHAHIDVAWLWPLGETMRKCGRTFATQLKLMEEYPEYRFLQSQAQCYAYTEKLYPDVFEGIKKAIKKDQWEVNGGMWVESDTNMPSAESLIRQFLYGKKYFQEKLGKGSDTLWLPDVFGYSANLPQILLGCEIPYFITSKIGWNDTNRFPYDTFRWMGVDGSEVLAHFIMGTYNGQTHPKAMADVWKAFRAKDRVKDVIYSVGYGDGGGGITRDHLEFVRRGGDLDGVPKAKWGSVSALMDRLNEDRADYPFWSGELYLELHRGTYTTQADTKKGNRKSEFLLRDCEMWRGLLGDYPTDDLLEIWQTVLTHQFHDILPGSSIQKVYDEAKATYAEVLEKLTAMTADGRTGLLADVNADGDGTPVAVWNSLGWSRRSAVYVPTEDAVRVVDHEGNPVPSQRQDDGVVFLTDHLPAVGYEVYRLVSGPPADGNPISASGSMLENEHLRVSLDDSGQLVSLFDKDANREVIAEGQVGNQLVLAEDLPVDWDAWDVDFYYRDKERVEDSKAMVTVMGTGPVEARVRVERSLGKQSRVVQDIVLRSGSRRVDFETEIDWQEDHTLLKAAFPVDVLAQEATYEIQGAYLARPNHTNTSWDWARFEVCGHKWADLSEGDYGVSLLNDCKYGHDTLGNVLRLTLLRSPKMPDPTADRGVHRFTYAILPHRGLHTGETMVAAHDLNVPVMADVVDSHGGSGSARRAFAEVSPGLFLMAMKKSEDGKGLILRVNELGKTRGSGWVKLDVPVNRAWRCNMLEKTETKLTVENGQVVFDYRPFEIVTIKVETA